MKTNAGTRLASMVIDHFIMTFLAMIFFIPGVITSFATAFQISHEQTSPDLFGGLGFIGLIGFALYFCKDSLNGRSPGKRTLKIQVVNNKSGLPASPLRCFVRNLLIILWPIEVIVTLANPSRRIGDLVAGTKVVAFDPDVEQAKPNYPQIVLSIALAYGVMTLFMIPVWGFNSLWEGNKVTYVESTLNENAVQELQMLFKNEFGNEIMADIRVYDQIQEDPQLKYVSLILTLDKDYLDNDVDFEEIQVKTIPLLLSKYPEQTFVGKIQYVYKEPGRMVTRTKVLDWRSNSVDSY